MKITEVEFPCDRLKLEGVLGLPDGEGPFPAVVVCHPHPLNGGSMHVRVVNSICKALVRSAVAALKFNFRGVGKSQGVHGGGVGEAEDVAAAAGFVSGLPEVDAGKIGVAGYSAGSAYSLPVAVKDERIGAYAAVCPALSMFDYSPLRGCTKPKFLICGDRDEYSPADEYSRLCRELAEPKECHLLEGADHFLAGYEDALAEEVAAFFAGVLRG